MKSIQSFATLVVFLCCYKSIQGYAPHGSDNHGSTSSSSHGGYHSHSGFHSNHGVVSKRSKMNKPTSTIPLPVLILDEFIIDALPLAGNDEKVLMRIMKDISTFAESILQQSGVTVQDQDVQKTISETISESVPQLSHVTDYKPPKLHFALALLHALRDKIYTDSSRMYQTVGAIQETAMAIEASLEDTSSKRQTTVGAHAETGPYGHSGGVSASHTWGHGDGSKTTVGGHVDHSHWGGTSGGISVSHTFG